MVCAKHKFFQEDTYYKTVFLQFKQGAGPIEDENKSSHIF